MEIIYELYIYNIYISCIFFIGIRSHYKIVNNGDYIPQNLPIRLRYHLFLWGQLWWESGEIILMH